MFSPLSAVRIPSEDADPVPTHPQTLYCTGASGLGRPLGVKGRDYNWERELKTSTTHSCFWWWCDLRWSWSRSGPGSGVIVKLMKKVNKIFSSSLECHYKFYLLRTETFLFKWTSLLMWMKICICWRPHQMIGEGSGVGLWRECSLRNKNF